MYRKLLILSLSALMIGAVAGCATNTGDSVAKSTAGGADQTRLISDQKNKIDALESRLQTRERELTAARNAKTQTGAGAASMTGGEDLFPPNAKLGHCYARVLIPARYKEETERVVVNEASERVEIIPARYDTVKERVLTKEASTRLETIPARYKTVEERVEVRPASTRIEEIPATYKTVSERILVAPARQEWKRGPASSFSGEVMQSRTTDTGEIMCLVEVPAQYRTVTRTVVDRAASSREIAIPAQYKTIKKTMLAEPAKTREIPVPAEYGTVDVTKLVQPAQERKIAIPAKYSTVTKRITVSEDLLKWREVLCEVNMTSANVRKLQTSLTSKGFSAGSADGVMGQQTLNAATQYAKKNGLPYGSNYIAVEVAKKLGL